MSLENNKTFDYKYLKYKNKYLNLTMNVDMKGGAIVQASSSEDTIVITLKNLHGDRLNIELTKEDRKDIYSFMDKIRLSLILSNPNPFGEIIQNNVNRRLFKLYYLPNTFDGKGTVIMFKPEDIENLKNNSELWIKFNIIYNFRKIYDDNTEQLYLSDEDYMNALEKFKNIENHMIIHNDGKLSKCILYEPTGHSTLKPKFILDDKGQPTTECETLDSKPISRYDDIIKKALVDNLSNDNTIKDNTILSEHNRQYGIVLYSGNGIFSSDHMVFRGRNYKLFMRLTLSGRRHHVTNMPRFFFDIINEKYLPIDLPLFRVIMSYVAELQINP